MEPNKRRRLCGKQAPIEGLNTRDTRNALQTFIRDRWVAQQMTARNLRGHEQRQRLRVEFSSKPDKSAVLEGMRDQVPQNLRRAAARSLLASWTIETPIVQEPVLLSYRGCGTMFRYSGSWSKIEDASITLLLTDQKPSIDEVCHLLRANAEVLRLWSDFQDFVKDLQRRFHLDRATAALELHSQVSLERKQAAVHLHLMRDSRKSVSMGKGDVVFRGAPPHMSVDCAQARGRSCRKAWDQGHYDLQCPKIGAIYMTTTAACYTCFGVSPEWVTSLWQSCKITKETAEKEYVKCKKHVRAYLENVKFHTQCVRADAVAERQAAALRDLQPFMRDPIRIQQVESDFLPQFRRPMFRRKFLVLTGPTRLGKTIYGRGLFGHDATMELNCSGVLHPDLREYDPLRHKAILFDEACCQMVLAHRKLFQGPVEEVSLAHSSTNMYSYSVFVYGVAMLITSNSWRTELQDCSPEDQEWLRGNSICIDCDVPLYKP